jgi:LytS/YehU family sensor histidine kinase
VLFPVVGLGHYHYGIMPLRYAMEFPADIAIFTLMVLFLHGARHLRRSRERELRAARLESGLAQAELRSLHLQIQPHFLFNALNTISSTLYEDPARADEMIDRLGELLRASLRTARSDEVSLREELQVLDAYLSLLAARFEDRLTVERDIADDVVSARVPPFLLQPLVENAVRHGGVESRGRGTIRLTARREGDEVVLTVLDDGPGLTPGVQETVGSEGIGLSATAERLQLLYGDEQRFTAATRPEGGFCVEIRLPA